MRNPAKDKQSDQRRGVTAPFLAILLVPMLGMVAFAVDYGYLAMVRSDLQRTADASVLAAAQDLIPANDGSQDLSKVRARLREYVAANLGTANDGLAGSFAVRDEDIVIERYDPATIYSGNIQFLQGGIKDTVRVTLRRDTQANSPVQLFFARVLGIGEQSVEATATAVLRRGSAMQAGADVLPFAVHINTWNALSQGELFHMYNGGKVLDNSGNEIPGNFGTVDIGLQNNSTSDMSDQIVNGLRQSDLDSLHSTGRIPDRDKLLAPVWLQADTGLSSGLKHGVQSIHGQYRIIPIFNETTPVSGNNVEYRTIAWGVVQVIDSHWQGSQYTYVSGAKAYLYESALVPHQDLSGRDSQNEIVNAFTSPVLVQ